MTENDKLQRIEKPTVIRCPHLEGNAARDKFGLLFDGMSPDRFPDKLVGQENYLALCEDCRDKLELAFLREWLNPKTLKDVNRLAARILALTEPEQPNSEPEQVGADNPSCPSGWDYGEDD